jgi:hypothetical protein
MGRMLEDRSARFKKHYLRTGATAAPFRLILEALLCRYRVKVSHQNSKDHKPVYKVDCTALKVKDSTVFPRHR